LDRGDEVILDLLPPESSPTRAFEVMVVGRIGKAVLDQVLASFTIPAPSCITRFVELNETTLLE
jgi:hypothetical protein